MQFMLLTIQSCGTDDCFFMFGFDGDEFCESLERVRDYFCSK